MGKDEIKARVKAFDAAAAHMTAKDTYETAEDYGWNLVWNAARDWTEKKWRSKVADLETTLGAEVSRINAILVSVTETAKLRLAKIRAMQERIDAQDRTSEDQGKKINTQAGIIQQQRANLHAQHETITRLRDERAPSEARDRELRLAKLRNENLSRRLNTTEAQLAEARALTTQGTTTVFEENERLVAEVRRVTSLLADAEEELIGTRVSLREERERHKRQGVVLESVRSALNASMAKRDELLTRALAAEQKAASVPIAFHKPEGEGWVLSWVKMTGETITGTVTPDPVEKFLRTCGATGNSPGNHTCLCLESVHHQGLHKCDCGNVWINTGIKRAEPLVRCMAVSFRHACELMTQPGKEHSPAHRCHCGMLWG